MVSIGSSCETETEVLIPCNGHLGANVAELSECGVEEPVLLNEWPVVVRCLGFSGLEFHVGVCDFGNIGEKEHRSEDEDKRSDGQIDPLHVAQGVLIVEGEEDVRAHEGSHNRPNSIEGL